MTKAARCQKAGSISLKVNSTQTGKKNSYFTLTLAVNLVKISDAHY